MPLLTTTSAVGLGRRRWSCPQQCYLHCLCAILSPYHVRVKGKRWTWPILGLFLLASLAIPARCSPTHHRILYAVQWAGELPFPVGMWSPIQLRVPWAQTSLRSKPTHLRFSHFCTDRPFTRHSCRLSTALLTECGLWWLTFQVHISVWAVAVDEQGWRTDCSWALAVRPVAHEERCRLGARGPRLVAYRIHSKEWWNFSTVGLLLRCWC